jgi:hypothetical protein
MMHRMLALGLELLAILLAAAAWFKEWNLLLAIGAIYLAMLVLSLQSATFNTLEAMVEWAGLPSAKK